MTPISIIIPTLNEQNYLPLLLDSIIEQKYGGKLQIIVVDGDSKDDTVKVAESYKERFSDLKVIRTEPNVGSQRNIGVLNSWYERLLFLDADVILPASCLNTLAKYSFSDRFIAATFHRSPKMNVLDFLSLVIIYFLFLIAWIARTPVVNGDFILTSKNLHKSIGGFKEGAILGEDTDYGVRAVKAGATYKFLFRTHVIASDRRLKQMGRIKLISIWSKAFIRARKEKPTYKNIDYPFGHYDD
ncbi:MAG: glycosyltransferase [Candidatus Saccharimonadales bacterium]